MAMAQITAATTIQAKGGEEPINHPHFEYRLISSVHTSIRPVRQSV